MVYCILKGDRASISDVPFSRMDIRFVDDSVLIVENSNGKINALMQKNELESPVSDEELGSVSDILYIPPDRLTMKKKDGHLVNSLDYSAQELYETIRSAKDDNELRIVEGQDRREMNDSDLEFWCKDLKAKLDFMKDAGFEPKLPDGLRFPPSRYDLIDNKKAYEDLAYAVSAYIDRDYQLAESIIVFKDIINNIYLNKSIEVTDTGKLIVQMRNGTSIPLNKLS
jgi:hypothetical protein